MHALSSMTIMDAKNEPVSVGRAMCPVSLVMSSLPRIKVPEACDSHVINCPLFPHCNQYCEPSWCIVWYTPSCDFEGDNLCTCRIVGRQSSYEADLHGYLLRLMNTGSHVCQQNRNTSLRFCAPVCDFYIS